MKTLVLMRHAKSDWSSGATSDHERPLNDRGIKTAPLMGEYLQKNIGSPPLIVCSTAVRARQTAELVAKSSVYTGEISTKSILYGGTPENYVHTIKDFNDNTSWALLIGHNPLLEETVSLLLTGRTHGLQVVMPTAAMVCMVFDANSWSKIGTGTAMLRWMKIPKMGED